MWDANTRIYGDKDKNCPVLTTTVTLLSVSIQPRLQCIEEGAATGLEYLGLCFPHHFNRQKDPLISAGRPGKGCIKINRCQELIQALLSQDYSIHNFVWYQDKPRKMGVKKLMHPNLVIFFYFFFYLSSKNDHWWKNAQLSLPRDLSK